MVKLIFFPHYIFYLQEILINKILDFLPFEVIHDIKYSCWKLIFIGKKLKEIKFRCTQKFASQNFSIAAICKSSSMRNLKILQILASQNFLQYYNTNFKTIKSKSIFFFFFFFFNLPCASSMSKLLQVYLITYAHFIVVEHC